MKPLVYLAGPYSAPDPITNMHDAFQLATHIVDVQLVTPVVPHLSGVWNLVTPRPYEWWMDYDRELLAHCDALYRMPGASPGADNEVRYAVMHDIPTFFLISDLYDWAKGATT